MEAYHGTNSKFTEFSLAFLGENTDENASSEGLRQSARLGIWFTENVEMASEVYDNVLHCDLSISNLLEVDSLETLEYWVESQELSGEELRERLIEEGYDGIVIEYDEEFEGRSFVVFSPENINIL